MQYSTIQYNTIQYNIIQYSTMQYATIQYNIRQYNGLLSSARGCVSKHVIGCDRVWKMCYKAVEEVFQSTGRCVPRCFTRPWKMCSMLVILVRILARPTPAAARRRRRHGGGGGVVVATLTIIIIGHHQWSCWCNLVASYHLSFIFVSFFVFFQKPESWQSRDLKAA